MSNSNKIISSLIWKFMERFGTVGVQFIIQLVLARLLSPSDFGAIALITVFITISNVFVQNGFSTALIQQKEIREEDYSSVFILTFTIAFICYIILFLLAPFIASFYALPILKNVLRVLSLVLFVGAYNSIQIAKISRNFRFKQLFFSSLIAIVISGSIGVYMAFKGYGIWALVSQQLINQIIVTIVLLFETKWIPKLTFNIKRVKKLFKFGSNLLLSSLIDVVYNNLYSLVIGKVFSAKDLGYYNRADQFPNLIVYNINGSIQSVILPALSEHQTNLVKMKSLLRRSMMLSAYLIFPIMLGLSACATPIVSLLLTDKWLPIVPMLKLLCISYMLWPIHTANLQAINALGRSDIYLRLEIIKKIIGIFALVISIPFGILAMICMKILTGFISAFINARPNKRLLSYGYFEQIKDLCPAFALSIIMYIVIELFNIFFAKFIESTLLLLAIEITLGVFIYLILSFVTKNDNFKYILDLFKKRRKSK